MSALRNLSAVVVLLGAICSAMVQEDDAFPAYWPMENRQAMYGEAGGKLGLILLTFMKFFAKF